MKRGAFATPDGSPVTAVTAAEMREVDRVAVEEYGLQLLQMMENAGRTLAGLVDPGPDARSVVLAGSGGNGGGGLAAARHLLNRGRDVSVVLDRSPADLEGAAATQWRVLDAAGVDARAEGAVPDADVLVDALVGYGLSGALRGTAADLAAACNHRDARVVSLDVPSGVDATTGDAPGEAVRPDRTVTLALPKTGLAAVGGGLVLADITVPAGVYARLDVPYERPFGEGYHVEIRRG